MLASGRRVLVQAEYSGLTCALNILHSNQKGDSKGWVALPAGLLIIDEPCGGTVRDSEC